MVDEPEKTEPVEMTDEMPKAFDDAMDTIEKENKVVPLDSSEEVEPEVEPEKEPEVEPEVEPEEKPADEVPSDDEILNGMDRTVLSVIQEEHPGWDDGKIALFAKNFPDLLDSLKDVLDEPEVKEEVKEEPKEEVKPSKLDGLIAKLDPDIHGQEVVDIMKAFAEQQKQDGKTLTEEQARLQKRESEAFNVEVESIFDKFELPDLGNSSKKLSRKEYMVRGELFAHARVTADLREIPIKEAIEVEINKHKNQGGEKVAEQKVLDKLEKQRKRTTNPPTRRHSDIADRKFANEEDKKEAIMEDAYQEAGID